MTVETVDLQSKVNPEVGALPTAFPAFLSTNIIDLFLLKGKAAVVTGGIRGIGFAVCEAYCQAQLDQLAIIDYSPYDENLRQLQSRYPKTDIRFYTVDVTKAAQVQRAIEEIVLEFGKIDIFVANAGIAWTSGALIDQDSDDEWLRVMDVDVNGVYYCAKHVGRQFRKQGFGSLVMTASMSSHIVNVPNFQACYNAAKAAVRHLGKSLAVEWAAFARVNSISPGYINTELSDFVPEDIKSTWYQLTAKGRQGTPKELVGAYLYLASDAANFTTGTDIIVDGGYCST
ncbi:putative diacetyl reductase [(R)-acetoin forming] 2 [Scheffersomyces spartinae]|uniref:Diacetyl reductase [(R)-acetoin forming] 2 n=1 Tax=Scheffersomyces spartinae TaxID=45513 RepID=A0A9P7V920_9ASCO|nr:putative diacetyl reductase [(R)-acetoin forming] 2 [Scheffersomyces spartinae]KAG7193616.1 putative diacetyl reductase [(R)-acetoin forming] 2 [Scheffersomyces spartinae]